jgi:hypothetical protein
MSPDPPLVHTRRRLRFTSLADVPAEARRLAPAHRTLRQWTLAQICRHLADTLHGSMTGFDLRNHRFKRLLLRRWLWRYTLRWGIPEGYTVDPALNPPVQLELGRELERLERAVVRYHEHTGALQPHPLFGTLSREDWDRLHRLHAAHHLSFVLETGAEQGARARP